MSVLGALVTISSSDHHTYELKEDPDYPGYYISENFWSAQSGITYHLHIEVDFNADGTTDIYEATSTIENKIVLDSIRVVPLKIMGHKNYAVNIYGQDPPEKDYYLFHIAVNDSLVTGKLSDHIISDDQLFNGEYIRGMTIEYFNDISEWETDSEEIRKQSVYLKRGDLITVSISKIEQGYYDFIAQCNREREGENPMFGGPASNIYTNISNGGVGFFTGYESSRSGTGVE